jgi:colicin import membrane protein
MAEFKEEEFKFPDEASAEPADNDNSLEIEIEDDTPEEDKGRKPADPEKVKALEVEVDELDKYSKDAKDKMIQMKRVWNDERRAKEAAERERQAAIEAAQRLLEDNNRMKAMINAGQEEYKDALKDSAKMQLKMAKKAYKEAYEAGDAEAMIEAQEALAKATMKEEKIKAFKPQPLQEERFDVQIQNQYQPAPRLDDKVVEWQESNPWFGQDEEMTAAALGLHEKLKRNGVKIGSDEYYATLDKTMRKRFPENFEGSEEVVEEQKEDAPKAKPKTVVAPATRSTASKKVKLKTSQVAIAKKLGLTPEQYVRELLKLEA